MSAVPVILDANQRECFLRDRCFIWPLRRGDQIKPYTEVSVRRCADVHIQAVVLGSQPDGDMVNHLVVDKAMFVHGVLQKL